MDRLDSRARELFFGRGDLRAVGGDLRGGAGGALLGRGHGLHVARARAPAAARRVVFARGRGVGGGGFRGALARAVDRLLRARRRKRRLVARERLRIGGQRRGGRGQHRFGARDLLACLLDGGGRASRTARGCSRSPRSRACRSPASAARATGVHRRQRGRARVVDDAAGGFPRAAERVGGDQHHDGHDQRQPHDREHPPASAAGRRADLDGSPERSNGRVAPGADAASPDMGSLIDAVCTTSTVSGMFRRPHERPRAHGANTVTPGFAAPPELLEGPPPPGPAPFGPGRSTGTLSARPGTGASWDRSRSGRPSCPRFVSRHRRRRCGIPDRGSWGLRGCACTRRTSGRFPAPWPVAPGSGPPSGRELAARLFGRLELRRLRVDSGHVAVVVLDEHAAFGRFGEFGHPVGAHALRERDHLLLGARAAFRRG